MPLSLQQAYDLMLNDLATFMNRVPVIVYGAGSKVNEVDYYLSLQGTQARGWNQGVATVENRVRFTPTSQSGAKGPIKCIHIPVTEVEKLKPEHIVRVSHYDDAKFLCTTRLSGCTFAIRQGQGNSIEFVHLRPTTDFPAKDLQRAAQNEFQTSFGRGDQNSNTTYDDTTAANIIGVRKNGLWHIYAQHSDAQFNVIRSECIYRQPSGVQYVT